MTKCVLVLLCCSYLLGPTEVAQGQSFSPAHPDDIFWELGSTVSGLHRDVEALIEYNGSLVAAGRYLSVAVDTEVYGLAAWDGASWSPIGTGFTRYQAGVQAGMPRVLAVYNGQLIVAGLFDTASGVPAENIAAWDGTTWHPLGSGLDWEVLSMVVYDNQLVVGGNFIDAGGLPANYVAAWDGSEWSALGAGTGGAVYSLEVFDGQLTVGGSFHTAGGNPAEHIAAWNGTSWSPLGSGISSTVLALTSYNDVLVAAGPFTTAGGIAANGTAMWNGSTWSPMGTGSVWAKRLCVYSNYVFAGGSFTSTDGANYIACWNGYAWVPVARRIAGEEYEKSVSGPVKALTVYNDRLLAGGIFDYAGESPARDIAAWDASSRSWSALGAGWSGRIRAFSNYEGSIVAAGTFSEIEGVAANRIAAWNGSSWSALGQGIGGNVNHLAVYNNQLIAGGMFTEAGGTAALNVAAWNGGSWSPLESGLSGAVQALTIYDGDLIAAYLAHTFNGYRASGITKWDGVTWVGIGSAHSYWYDLDAYVTDMIEYDNELIVAGDFFNVSNTQCQMLAAWDGNEWHGMGGMPLFSSCLAVYNGDLYVGFLGEGSIRVWDGSSWSLFVDDPITIGAMSVYNDELIACGWLTGNGLVSANIGAWDGTNWFPLGSGTNGWIEALGVFDDKLWVAGDFAIAGGNISAYLARWNKWPTTSVAVTGFEASTSHEGVVLRWSVDSDERIKGFHIYRSGVDGALKRTINDHQLGPDTRSFVDATATPGERHCYTLDVLGEESGHIYSQTIEAEMPPLTLQLDQNSPNPFNPATSIRYVIPVASRVTLTVFSPEGRLVRTLVEEYQTPGSKAVTWNGTNDAGMKVASGVYVYRLQAGKATLSRKMTLLK